MSKLIVVLGVLGASFSAIFVRFATAPSVVLVVYRMLFAVVVLFPIMLLKHREELKWLARWDVFLCICSGCFLGLHFLTYFESLRYTDVASSVTLVDMEVFFVALGARFLTGEHISRKGWIGIVAVFFGSVIITLGGARGGSNPLRGDLLALVGAFFVACYTMLGKIVRSRLSTTVYTTIVYAAGTLTVLIAALWKQVPLVGYGSRNLLCGLGLAVFCTLLGHSIFSWALKYETAAFISAAKLLEPVYSSIMAVFLFQEVLTLQTGIGAVIIIGGILYYVRHPATQLAQIVSPAEEKL
ncbi:MAG: DMT family transporter [Oscillospiraceae bacterium]